MARSVAQLILFVDARRDAISAPATRCLDRARPAALVAAVAAGL